MGCVASKNRGSGDDPEKGETQALDPDLGWRCLMPSKEAGQDCSPHYPNAVAAHGGGGGGKQTQWTISTINVITKRMYKGHLVIMALNISLRAATLAKRFGVIPDRSSHSSSGMAALAFDSGGGDGGDGDDGDLESTIPAFRSGGGGGGTGGGGGGSDNLTQLYRYLEIPDLHWRLVDRRYRGKPPSRPELTEFEVQLPMSTGGKVGANTWFQRMHSPERQNAAVLVDVVEVGMNIAEQLYRLETHEASRHPFPDNDFGWTVTPMHDGLKVGVADPSKSEAYWMIPEEVIMNVATWVQKTYLTQTGL
eukprot:GHVU01023101.1.p1 GENE.GHVU01023101.1~~GHVU01023101.1.p1  ORF type:complete len:307 (+),score=53.48 GHVU01023101.1:190-1110(+)